MGRRGVCGECGEEYIERGGIKIGMCVVCRLGKEEEGERGKGGRGRGGGKEGGRVMKVCLTSSSVCLGMEGGEVGVFTPSFSSFSFVSSSSLSSPSLSSVSLPPSCPSSSLPFARVRWSLNGDSHKKKVNFVVHQPSSPLVGGKIWSACEGLMVFLVFLCVVLSVGWAGLCDCY